VFLVLVGLLWFAILSARESYAPRILISRTSQIARVISAFLPAWVLTHLLAFLLKAEIPFESRLAVSVSLPATALFLVAARLLLTRPLARRTYRRLTRGPVLVLGDSWREGDLMREVESTVGRGRKVWMLPLDTVDPDSAARMVHEAEVSEVVLEPRGTDLDEIFDIAFACLDARAEVTIASKRFDVVAARAAMGETDGTPAMRFRRPDLTGPEGFVKRVVDVLGAFLGLLVLSPLLLTIAAAVKLSSAGPILYRQERVGQKGRRFLMYKFRSMTDGNDPRMHREYLESFIRDGAPASVSEDGSKVFKLTADSRVTPVGAWLRALSLDELPQLWNVLRGEMSLVGPRPCLPYEWDLYRSWQRRRLDVVPGCTGLWQVTARSRVSFEEMVMLDLHYAHHGTVGGDLLLILCTVPAMIRGRGGY